jgi:hypothetical protein
MRHVGIARGRIPIRQLSNGGNSPSEVPFERVDEFRLGGRLSSIDLCL